MSELEEYLKLVKDDTHVDVLCMIFRKEAERLCKLTNLRKMAMCNHSLE